MYCVGPGVMHTVQGAPGAAWSPDRCRRHVPHPRPGVRGNRRLNLNLPQEFAVGIENLNARVAAIGHVDVALRVVGDAMRRVELSRPLAGRAE